MKKATKTVTKTVTMRAPATKTRKAKTTETIAAAPVAEIEEDKPVPVETPMVEQVPSVDKEVSPAKDGDRREDHRREIPLLDVQVSETLGKKLRRLADEEGIGVDALATELLTEGVVSRAWEVMERKATMRGGNPNFRQGNNRQGQNRYDGGRNNPRGFKRNNQKGGGNWMEDKAAFLEYVRNQEKGRR